MSEELLNKALFGDLAPEQLRSLRDQCTQSQDFREDLTVVKRLRAARMDYVLKTTETQYLNKVSTLLTAHAPRKGLIQRLQNWIDGHRAGAWSMVALQAVFVAAISVQVFVEHDRSEVLYRGTSVRVCPEYSVRINPDVSVSNLNRVFYQSDIHVVGGPDGAGVLFVEAPNLSLQDINMVLSGLGVAQALENCGKNP